MRFLLDEDVPVEAARCLKQAGHDVTMVAEDLGPRTDDVDIWRQAIRIDAIVITCNRQDFLQLAGTAPEKGVIILNRRRTRQSECQCAIDRLTAGGLDGIIPL